MTEDNPLDTIMKLISAATTSREQAERRAEELEAKRDELQASIQELEERLAQTIADARLAAMVQDRVIQGQAQQFQAEFGKMVESANAAIAERDAKIAELEGVGQ